MITLDGTHGWVISYTNKHNISGKLIEETNYNNWTFCSSVKPNWDPEKVDMNIAGKGYRGGVLCRNGRHAGIFNVLWPFDDGTGWSKFMKGEIWYDPYDGGSPELASVQIPVEGDGWVDCVLTYDRDNNLLVFQCREEHQDHWTVKSTKVDGDIIDYTGSHIWIGCANAFPTCEEPQFYSGHIRCLGVFNNKFDEEYRDKFYKEYLDFKGINKYFRGHSHRRQVYNFEEMKPLTFTNFKTTTMYKAYDFSGNGNHPILYKREWGVY